MKKIIIITILSCLVTLSYAGLTGQETVIGGQQYTYYWDGGAPASWQCSGGTIISSSSWSATITWGTGSYGYVFCWTEDYSETGSLDITIVNLPAMPSAYSPVISSETSYTARWSQVSGAEYYTLMVADNAGFNNATTYSLLTTTSQAITKTAGSTSFYKVRASNYAGNSNYSTVITVVPAPTFGNPTNITTSSFNISWNSVTGAEHYHLLIAGDEQFWSVVDEYSGSNTAYSASNLSDYSIYYIKIRSENDSCSSLYSDNKVVSTLLANDLVPHNFIRSTTIFAGGVKSSEDISAINDTLKSVQYSFFDGLGRPDQNVIKKASPSQYDIIQPFAYDEYGREVIKYLSYSDDLTGYYRQNPLSAQAGFYLSGEKVAVDSFAFSETIFDNSPLNRVLEQGAPGDEWQPGSGHTLKYDYLTNDTAEVLIFTISDGALVYDSTAGEVEDGKYYYLERQLFKNLVKDENWQSGNDSLLHTTEEFRDKQGNVVLKRSYVRNEVDTIVPVETYYVYDDLGLLKYVIPPQAVSQLAFPSTKDSSVIKSLCYYYEYDSRRRLTLKQLPGAEPVFMVYDLRDRLVASQDGNNREDGNTWLFTKYDVLDRPVLTGIYNPGVSYNTQAAMQALVDQFYNSGGKYYEKRGSSVLGYSCQSFPNNSSLSNYLTAIYYDDYSYSGKLNLVYNASIPYYRDNEGDTLYFDRTRGKVTGTKTRVLNTDQWLMSTTYYDDRYRVIQTVSQNFTGGHDVVSNNYDFVGNITSTRQTHAKSGTTPDHTLVKDYKYDHMNRLVRVYHKVNSQDRVLMSSLEYNELGQLVEKNLHSSDDGVNFTQSVDYRYNIRGWLKSINNDGLTNDSGLTNDDSGDKFGMELFYESLY